MTANELIASGCRMAQELIHRLTNDISATEFHHQPFPGANSAAWNVGHLAQTYRNVAKLAGATELPDFPEELTAKLKTTGTSAGDQSKVGEKAELLKLFDSCVEVCATTLANMPSEALDAPAHRKLSLTDAKSSGELLSFVTGQHAAMHAGQIGLIRRSLGKPPLA